MPKRPSNGNPRGAGRKPYKPPDALEDFLHSLTDADSIYTLQQPLKSVKSSSVKSEDGDPDLATVSDLPSGISRVTSMDELNTFLDAGRRTSVSASQSLAHSDALTQDSSVIHSKLRTPQDIKVDLAALAQLAARFRREDSSKRTLEARMKELRALMAHGEFVRLEFRPRHSFSSDVDWDQGLPPFGTAPLKRYWLYLEHNVTKLVLLLTLEKQGKLALQSTEEESDGDSSVTGLFDSLKSFQHLGGPFPPPEFCGPDGIENTWDEEKTWFENLWGRIKRYRTLLLKHSRKGKEKLDEDAASGNSDQDEESENSEPSDHIKREGSVERTASEYSQTASNDSGSEGSLTDEFEPPWPKDTLPGVLKDALKEKLSKHPTERFRGLLDDDVNDILVMAYDLRVRGVHRTYLQYTVLPLLCKHPFPDEGDDIDALLGYIW